ncbi:MAG TPA: exosortase/archaeosortase family protein, partial [Anaerolineae bacterium]|nr:exosortase/archaeosortase family protein [Anaerolineae bacterium]
MKPERRSALAAALVVVLLLALSFPTLRWLVNEWLTNDYYSHGWLVLPVSAYLAWRQWPKGDTTPANLGLIPLGLGLVAYLVALLSKAYFVAALALIVLLVGLVWLFLGTRALRRLAFPLGFLIFMVPLPFVERASLPLQLLTGVCSTAVARVVGMDASVKGAQVTLPNVDLVVGAQCSGLRSI